MFRQSNRRHFNHRRRGAVVVKVAILLPVLLMLCAFAINVCYMHLAKAQLRSVSDFSARAAASTYASTGSQTAATDVAVTTAGRHIVGTTPYQLNRADVLFGGSGQASANGRFTFTQSGTEDNAVHVIANVDRAPLLFRGFLSQDTFTLSQDAVATFSPVDIVLVLDRSSSMKLATSSTAGLMSASDSRYCQTPKSDCRWVALAAAVSEFITVMNSTRADERVALVTYGSTNSSCSNCHCTDSDLNVDLTESLSAIQTEMDRLSNAMWNGGTNIHSGIVRGTSVLMTSPNRRAKAKKTMILLTDGVYTGPNPIPYAQTAANQNITIHTVTFSAGANQTDMKEVARIGKGKHYHAPDPATLRTVFRELAAMPVLLTQ